MKVFASDLASPEIQGFVESSGEWATAEDGTKALAVEADELQSCFADFAHLFCQAESGPTLAEAAVQDWPVFSSEAAACRILQQVLRAPSCEMGYSLTDSVTLKPEILSGVKVWERLKKEVREEKRFFAGFEASELSEWLSPEDWLRQGAELYRARVVPRGREAIAAQEMGSPPPEKASGGRANPEGIAYLYLAESELTTVYEVRALYLDRITIGRFSLQKDEPIVDFAAKGDIFASYFSDGDSLSDVVRKRLTLRAIGYDLSRPLRRYDNPAIEYTPTQAVCEFCKLQGAGGIRFRSSLHPDGVNVVLFDPARAACQAVRTVEVTSLQFAYDELSRKAASGGAA